MMTMAALIPIPSLGPGDGEATALIGAPPRATCRPGPA
jgi:hypothetical protein